MKYSVQAFNGGTFWVPGPEVYWMEAWNQREEMNALIYLIRGGGQNILINTGPPQDLTVINQAWLNFFGYPEAQIVRSEAQLPQNILASQGLTPDDISMVLVTPLQAYATANIHMFRNATIGISRRGWIEDFQAPYYHLHVPRHLRIPPEVNHYLQNVHARHERMIASYHAARFRQRWADTGAVASRASALLEEAWSHALVAHRLDLELDGTPLSAEIGELVAELARRRVESARPERAEAKAAAGEGLFSARRAPSSRVVAASPAMRQVLRRCDGYARYDGPVLLLGERGTGKELLAHRIHETSPRSARPFLVLNCATAATDSVGRELFGAIDARGTCRGLVERAQGGTLLLSSVESLPEAVQERLLILVRDGTWRPLGGSRDRRGDVRLIAASGRDLAVLADQGLVRPDLYFRLRLMTVPVPALRERPEDVMPLLDHFLTRLEGAALGARMVFDQTGLEALTAHDWPGNGAEVESIAQQAWLHRDLGRPLSLVRLRRGDRMALEFAELADERPPGTVPRGHASGLSWETLNALIARAGGNKARAARQLGVSRVTLYRWLNQLDPQQP